jgi:hypothetical protein
VAVLGRSETIRSSFPPGQQQPARLPESVDRCLWNRTKRGGGQRSTRAEPLFEPRERPGGFSEKKKPAHVQRRR